jgi:hypothetical protein
MTETAGRRVAIVRAKISGQYDPGILTRIDKIK